MVKKKLEEEIQLGYNINLLQIPMNNSMLFDSVNFTANTAYNGGGASLFISSISTMQLNQMNNITFRNCAFVKKQWQWRISTRDHT